MTKFSRRDFLTQSSALGAMATLPSFTQGIEQERVISVENIEKASQRIAHLSPEEAAKDEDFWFTIQKAFVQSPHFINLENGY